MDAFNARTALSASRAQRHFKGTRNFGRKKSLHKLIQETEELLKIAAHHKFLNGNSIKVWSPLKSVHTALIEFEKSIND